MDYMKGYNSRNRRRRSSRNRTNRPKNDIINSSYYKNRSDQSRTKLNVKRIVIAGVLVVVVLVLLVWFGIRLFGQKPSDEPTEPVTHSASGAAVSGGADNDNGANTKEQPEATPTMDPEGLAATVSAVPTLKPDVVATPAPTPRPKAVALTFDDGPRSESDRTPKILKILQKHHAHATFFVLGQNVSKGVDVLKQEVKQGCEIANHSWDHTNLASLSIAGVNEQYNKTKKIVKKLVGYDIKLLRPPYGAIGEKMRTSFKHPMILWNVDTLDWTSRNPKEIFKEVKKQVKDGDIILMHDIHPTTADALDKVLTWLNKKGYDVLTVSELAKRKGKKMLGGKAYGGF